jgi:tetratricopeptide (TPR) repeat protein
MALEQVWVTINPREGVNRFETLLAGAGEMPPEVGARVFRDLGGSIDISGDWRRAADRYEQSLELFERIGDEASILHLRCRLAKCRVHTGDLAGARVIAEQALALARASGLRFQAADALWVLSMIATSEGDLEEAFSFEGESLEICREVGGWVWGESLMLMDLADLSARLERVDEAEIYGRESLEISLTIASRRGLVFGLAALAVAARVRHDVERAGTLWGAIEAEEERSFLGSWPTYRDWYASVVLSPPSDELDRALEDGRRMTLDEITEYALRGSSRRVPTQASRSDRLG